MDTKVLKVFLAVLLFVCLVDMPYGYYQVVRVIAMVGLSYLAYQSRQKDRVTEVFIYVILAILFQPFFKISLGRQIWNVVDLVVGIGLVFSLFLKQREK